MNTKFCEIHMEGFGEVRFTFTFDCFKMAGKFGQQKLAVMGLLDSGAFNESGGKHFLFTP